MSRKLSLMFHVVLGYPSLEKSLEIVSELCKRNVDYLEIQVPFSDPLADGPLIVRANQTALQHGVGLSRVVEAIMANRNSRTKLLLMSYVQPVFKVDPKLVLQQLKQAGAYGCIIPDLPIDQPEAALFQTTTLQFVPVLSPGITRQRIELYKRLKPKLIYCTARRGITGTKSQFDQLEYIKQVKRMLGGEVVVGFGIQQPSQLQELPGYVDGAVIGSRLIEAMLHSDGRIKAALQLVDQFIATRNQLASGTITKQKDKL